MESQHRKTERVLSRALLATRAGWGRTFFAHALLKAHLMVEQPLVHGPGVGLESAPVWQINVPATATYRCVMRPGKAVAFGPISSRQTATEGGVPENVRRGIGLLVPVELGRGVGLWRNIYARVYVSRKCKAVGAGGNVLGDGEA